MAAELVLQKHPLHLHIELASANKALPLIDGKRIYILRRHCKSWNLDQGRQVEIKRYGFPVVLDFGGTAHAYCGTSLEACIGDLQEWWMKPHKEAPNPAHRKPDHCWAIQPVSVPDGCSRRPQVLATSLTGQSDTKRSTTAVEKGGGRTKSSGDAGPFEPYVTEMLLPANI